MVNKYARGVLVHTAVLGAICAAACGYAGAIFARDEAALFVGAAGFAAAAIALLRYDAADWCMPPGVECANLRRRRDVGVALGAGAVACATLGASGDPLGHALNVCQTTVLAVAALNDFARFRLPLPTTIVGGGLAIAAAIRQPHWPWDVAFACAAAAALMLLYRRALRVALAGGDQLALLWIMLADPAYGGAAITFGQFVLATAVRIFDPCRSVRRVPIGGAWLMAAAWLLPLSRTWGAS